MALVIDQVRLAAGGVLTQFVLGGGEQRVHVGLVPLVLETRDEMRLVVFVVERGQRDEQVFRLQLRDAREGVVEPGVGGDEGKRFGEERLHVRLHPDFVEIGRFPVGHRLIEVRHRQQQERFLGQIVGGRRGGAAAAVTGGSGEVDRGPGSAEGQQRDERGDDFFSWRRSLAASGCHLSSPRADCQCAMNSGSVSV